MTTTDLAAARRAVARKRAANTPARRRQARNLRVIDGEARPTRSHLREGGKGIALLVMALLLAGLVLSLTGYYGS